MKNGFYVIDSHCHIYPEKIVEKAVAGTDMFYGTTAAGKGTTSDLSQIGENVGIDHFVVQSVATTPKQVDSINRFIADCVKNSDGKMTGLGTLHPDSDDIEGDINNIVALGLHGVKLHPDIQKFPLDDKKCMIMYELCQKNKLTMLIHTGDYRYDFSNPNRVEPVLSAFPDLVVVGAHLGGWSIWEEASLKLAKYDNFYVDCSSTFPFTSKEVAETALKRYGFDRVLFGTDYPMWHPKTELETVFTLGISDDNLKKVLSENAVKVFKIKKS